MGRATGTRPDLAVVHDTPGRLRVRVGRGASSEVPEAVAAVPGVVDCIWSARTRSLLVRYRPDQVAAAAILTVIATTAGVATPTRPAAAPAARSARSPVATALQRVAVEIDAAVRRRTGGLLDLGIAMPLVLGVWAVVEIGRGRLAPLAWSSALWYAHGLFRDYDVGAADAGVPAEPAG